MKPFDGKALGEQIVSFVRTFVAKQIAAVNARNDAIEAAVKAIPAGPKGDTGERGEKGIDGAAGPQGEIGPQGPQGEKGDPGDIGPQGPAGDIGPRGETGDAGERGPIGEKGMDGDIGPQGPAGEKGLDGKDGAPGKSAYDLAIEKGYSGTELQWLASLQGKNGERGLDGRDGKDGRDAVEIAILPMLEDGKAYPSGVYARHAGGLVKTTTTGFDVIVNGLAGISVEQISEREFRVKAHLTDGTESAQDFKIPVMLHRGIWAERAYERGDCVTRDNSTWHCCVESTTEKPGESKHWQLIVRKGDKGRDLTPPKPQGPVSVR